MSISDRLKFARQRAGLSGAQVKDRTEIGESSLSEFENGKREPSLSQLQKLAETYRRSVAFFLSEGPVVNERAILWRMRPPTGAEEIEVRFLQLCEQYHNLELWCGEHAPTRLPQASSDAIRFDYSHAEELAKRVRLELQLGDRPARCLLSVLEEVCGVKIFHLDFEPSGTAASAVSDSFGSAVLLNAKNVSWRRNHDLAHELFHLLTWSIFHPSAQESLIASEREEKFATAFASNLLMPTDPFRSAINSRMNDGKISIESLYDVAREFDVSVESVLWRMHFAFGRTYAEREETSRFIEQAKEFAAIFDTRENRPPERLLPDRYYALAVKALRRGEISTGRFAEYVGISRDRAMHFVEQELPDGDEIQVTPA